MENREIWLLHFSTFFFFLGYILVSPLISPLAILYGASPLVVGTIASVSSIFALVLKPIGGILGDRGKKFEVMMFGTILGALAGVFYALSIVAKSLVLFTVGRAIHGAASAFFFPSSLSTAIDLAPKGRVGETLGWRGTMFSISQLIGPALGGFVADYLGFQSAFILTIFLSIIGFGFIFIPYRKQKGLIKIVHDKTKASYKGLINWAFAAASFSLFFMVLAYSGLYTFLPAYYKVLGLGTSIFGVYASIMGAFSLLTRVFGGKQADKRGPIPVATVGLVLVIIAYVMLTRALEPPLAYLSAVPLGMGFGLAVPSLQMLALAKLPQKIRGFGSSLYTMFFDLGYLSGPLLLGYLANVRGTYAVVFPILPILTAFALTSLQAARMSPKEGPLKD
ncbi:hypothetical protein PAP_07640 [Palaeococcus pacificus DY20341]|uniref:Major facilitator superfamily (MFS) profile domain-containing protein n=1 Tax=Palaeococcus pacificus DY20341 TaxID=1343739 RepID=A0A075LV97_9EURY|nr:MFS transporter [Palaeococcus pacificus]AIF69917.1 hypothetical protein PAP_07640 [Palaeococcus pacificus DY20341]